MKVIENPKSGLESAQAGDGSFSPGNDSVSESDETLIEFCWNSRFVMCFHSSGRTSSPEPGGDRRFLNPTALMNRPLGNFCRDWVKLKYAYGSYAFNEIKSPIIINLLIYNYWFSFRRSDCVICMNRKLLLQGKNMFIFHKSEAMVD